VEPFGSFHPNRHLLALLGLERVRVVELAEVARGVAVVEGAGVGLGGGGDREAEEQGERKEAHRRMKSGERGNAEKVRRRRIRWHPCAPRALPICRYARIRRTYTVRTSQR